MTTFWVTVFVDERFEFIHILCLNQIAYAVVKSMLGQCVGQPQRCWPFGATAQAIGAV